QTRCQIGGRHPPRAAKPPNGPAAPPDGTWPAAHRVAERGEAGPLIAGASGGHGDDEPCGA
ncbi:hypothetical protein J7F04_10055, partial [Streptomyces sp. ISL-24]|uniref:hypothetical protein n=1 Tax=Streptomyces sp. ISL-24 TaxID=2819181 RepID=UPI001BE8AD9A